MDVTVTSVYAACTSRPETNRLWLEFGAPAGVVAVLVSCPPWEKKMDFVPAFV
jgi:hypothetical protein